MKHAAFFFFFSLPLCGAVLFSACAMESGGDKTFTVEIAAGETKYYSLSTGREVSGGNNTGWDIAFEKETGNTMLGPRIYTNSGATAAAAGSGGQGGVWYTDKTYFDTVVLEDKKDAPGEYAGLTVDTEKRVFIGTPYNTPLTTNMNVMTYLGYDGGDGAGNPYKAKNFTNPDTYVPYTFDKKQFFRMLSLREYETTDQVYIVRHGDGAAYSKVQITGFEMPPGQNKDVYQITRQTW